MTEKILRIDSISPEIFAFNLFKQGGKLAENMLVKMESHAEHHVQDVNHQTAQEVVSAAGRISSDFWAFWLGPYSLGQYTARTGKPFFAASRIDIVIRKPSEEEVQKDLNLWGSRVIGARLEEGTVPSGTLTTVNVEGKLHIYKGPPRLRSTSLSARILNCDRIPLDPQLREMVGQVDELHGEPGNSMLEYYFMLLAMGKKPGIADLRIATFKKCDDIFDGAGIFNRGKMHLLGNIMAFEDQKKLLLYMAKKGGGERVESEPIDCSDLYCPWKL